MGEEKGSIMVEAALVFPVVLMTVFAIIYLGLFKLQEIAVIYQVQRAAHQGAMVLASPGYQKLGNYSGNGIDFSSEPTDVNAYYKSCHENLSVLYRELFGVTWTGNDEMTAFLMKIGEHSSILAGLPLARQETKITRGFFGSMLTVETVIAIDTPGALRYLGLPDEIRMKRGAEAFALSPSAFVRDVDLAADAVVAISEKLGLDGQLNKLMENYEKIRDLLL